MTRIQHASSGFVLKVVFDPGLPDTDHDCMVLEIDAKAKEYGWFGWGGGTPDDVTFLVVSYVEEVTEESLKSFFDWVSRLDGIQSCRCTGIIDRKTMKQNDDSLEFLHESG